MGPPSEELLKTFSKFWPLFFARSLNILFANGSKTDAWNFCSVFVARVGHVLTEPNLDHQYFRIGVKY